MLTRVVLESSTPKAFDILDVDPDELIILKSISGLTPADVTLFTGDFASNGGYYQGRRSGRRYPVFNFKINPDYANDISASDARELLYSTFYEPQVALDGLRVVLEDDRKPDRQLVVYAEKWQGDIFADKPMASISTTCVEAYIQSVDVTTESFAGGWTAKPITYTGTADAGIQLTLKVVADTTEFTVANTLADLAVLKWVGALVAGDIITINTSEGDRELKVNGVDRIGGMTADSDWLSLKTAANNLVTYGHGGLGDGRMVITSYTYRANWWGV